MIVVQAYSRDYGSCGFTAHNGDPERVALHLVAPPGGGPGDVLATGAYTAAHEGTATDHGRFFTADDFVELTYADDAATGQPRWVVFPSADKHATYASLDICENISAIPCFDEDCGPDGVDDPAAFDLLPAYVNAGEDAARRVEDLGPLGFAGEDAWADQAFCGGLGTTDECSTKIRDKLLDDPFGVLP